jgi:hypothetical protein
MHTCLKDLKTHGTRVGNVKELTFRNIPPGNYEFLIKSRLRNQDWSPTHTSMQLIITPPLWLTWYAKGILRHYCHLIGIFFYSYLQTKT